MWVPRPSLLGRESFTRSTQSRSFTFQFPIPISAPDTRHPTQKYNSSCYRKTQIRSKIRRFAPRFQPNSSLITLKTALHQPNQPLPGRETHSSQHFMALRRRKEPASFHHQTEPESFPQPPATPQAPFTLSLLHQFTFSLNALRIIIPNKCTL
jgi:hypothetical protein